MDVSDIVVSDKAMSEIALLSLTASAEAKSEHPLGKAIVACARAKEVPVMESASFKMTAGRGIFAEIQGRNLLCGSEAFLRENGVSTGASVRSVLEQLRA